MRISPTLNDFKNISDYLKEVEHTTILDLSKKFQIESRGIVETLKDLPQYADKIKPPVTVSKVPIKRESISDLYSIDFEGWELDEKRSLSVRLNAHVDKLRKYAANEFKKRGWKLRTQTQRSTMYFKRIH